MQSYVTRILTEMEGKEFTLIQLKNTLRQLGLSQKGNKIELIKRLHEYDPSEQWKDLARTAREEETEQPRLQSRSESHSTSEIANEDERSEGQFCHVQQTPPPDAEPEQEDFREARMIMDMDLETVRRERDLLRREIESLRLERNHAVRTERSAVSSPNVSYPSVPRPSLTALSDLLSDFYGEEDTFERWQKQFDLVRTTYQLDDNMARILVGMKTKDRASQWFHSRPEHLQMPIDELMRKMNDTFNFRPAKVDRRRQFERRIWRSDESFSNYYFDKIILAGRVPVDEEEIVEHLIDGIPDVQLRNQARMHCFERKEDFRRAFGKVTLPPEQRSRTDQRVRALQSKPLPKTTVTKEVEHRRNDATTKCYNCNKSGHLARNCDKPRRERGSCFECGATDHRVRECMQKKQTTTASTSAQTRTSEHTQISNVVEQQGSGNEYQKRVECQLVNDGRNFRFEVNSQIDTASPISLIKAQFVPPSQRLESRNERYEGINGSALKVQGTTAAKITFENVSASKINLRIVPDNTMRCDVLLGRDAIKMLGLRLTKRPLEETLEHVVNEILSIETDEPDSSNVGEFKINPDLPYVMRSKFLESFQSDYVQAERPTEPKVRAELELHTKDKQPFHFAPSRLSVEEKNKLREILNDLNDRGIIRPGSSEYASRTVLVRKRDGKIRMCIDYRALNKITARDNFPLPIIEEQIDALYGKRYFTSLDLRDGFHHVFMAKNSVKYTAFVTPFGQFEYLKMPFGLKNAPARFQRYINEIFSDLIKEGNIVVYMDDFLVATETVEQHLEVLRQVYKILVENLLQLRLDKCKFLYQKIEFLGYTITAEGVRPNDSGIAAVKDFPTPRCARDVQSFLGLCSYFRKFIRNFSLIAGPLYDLVRKNAIFEFGSKQMDAFETLKNKLTSNPILSIYSPNDETELHCDASMQGFGAVLLQRKADGKFHPIFYFSKRTSEAEARYHSYELETLAIIYAIKRFRIYLQGIRFKIVTDCNALILTLNKKDINPRIARWALELQNYDHTTEHRPGKRMPHVDALSRVNNILVIEANTFEFNLAACQSQDQRIAELRARLEEGQDGQYEMRNGLIYRKRRDKILFYVPRAMEQELLHKYHNDFGHFGMEKTYTLLRETYWFPEMKAKIRNYIKNCLKCLAFSKPSGKVEGFMFSKEKGSVPFDTIHVDHFGPVDKTNAAKKYVFVIVDAFSKYVRFYAVKTTTTRETIRCLKNYFSSYSRPKILISDRGTCFTSNEFEEFVNEANIKHIKVATGSPQANGQVERYNRILGPALGKLYDGKNWDKSLEEIEFAINNTISRVTGETPSRLLFGVAQRGRIVDNLREYIEEQSESEPRDLTKMRSTAADKIEKASAYNETNVNKKRKPAEEYEEGDLVMVRNFETAGGKLSPAYRGPYRIVRRLKNNRYIIRDIEGCQISRRPYQGTWEAANMKPWLKDCNPIGSQEIDSGAGDSE